MLRMLLLTTLFLCVAIQQISVADTEEDISFVAAVDGSEQRYVLWQPSEVFALEGCSIIIALHGHGSDRWQFIQNPRDECRAVRDMARKHNMAVLSPDYRAATSWMGPTAESDLLQIIGEYRQLYHPPKVLLVGGSMGAASALTFAALHPETVDGVVAMNGIANHEQYTGFQTAISVSFGGSKAEKPEEYKKRSAEFSADRLTMSIAFTVGGLDDVTPPESIRRLAEKLNTLGRNVLLIESPGGGHETSYEHACQALEYVICKTAHIKKENHP